LYKHITIDIAKPQTPNKREGQGEAEKEEEKKSGTAGSQTCKSK
jgi:hypothetical protein